MTESNSTPALPERAEGPEAPAHPEPVEGSRYETLPAFTPVPRQMDRHDGWKPEVQRAFIEALADTGSVKAAALSVGRAARGAYFLRRHPEAGEFRRAWDAALDIGVRQIEDGVMDRAINGVETPIHSKGEVIGYRTVHNERLTTFILQNRAPERFGGLRKAHGAKGANAIDQMELKRLKREWEAARAMEDVARLREHGQTLVEFIRLRHLNWWTGLGPRAREAYLQFRRIEREDTHDFPEDVEAHGEQIIGDYEAAFGTDGRAKIDKLVETEGPADAEIFGDEPYTPPPGRFITLQDQGWIAPGVPDDGRGTPWP